MKAATKYFIYGLLVFVGMLVAIQLFLMNSFMPSPLSKPYYET